MFLLHCTSNRIKKAIYRIAPIYHQALFPTKMVYAKLLKLDEPISIIFPPFKTHKFALFSTSKSSSEQTQKLLW